MKTRMIKRIEESAEKAGVYKNSSTEDEIESLEEEAFLIKDLGEGKKKEVGLAMGYLLINATNFCKLYGLDLHGCIMEAQKELEVGR